MATITPRGATQTPGQPTAPRLSVQATTSNGRLNPKPPTAVVSPSDTTKAAETTPPAAVTLPPQVSALARKEQAFQAKVQAFEAEKKAWAEKNPSQPPPPTIKEQIRKTPSKALQELGLTYDELTQALLSEQNGVDPNNEAIQTLANKLETIEAKQKEDQEKNTKTIIAQYETEIAKLVDNDPEFETIKARGLHGHVLQHILDTFNEDGEILTVEQASKEIEDVAFEDALKVSGLKKVQAKLGLPDPNTAKQKQTLPPPGKQAPTQPQTPVVAAQTDAPNKQMQHLSPNERLQQAIAKANQRINQR